jgi:subtilase family serine protease
MAAMMVFLAALTGFGAEPGRKILSGHMVPATAHLVAKGNLPATNELRLAIGLPLRDASGLEKFLAEVSDPASPRYRQYLTPEQFTARFGPTEPDYAAVQDFARTNGFKIVATHGNRLLLDVRASVKDIQRTFHISLKTYRHPGEARDFFAPDTEPTVEAVLPVADVSGLSDYARPQPRVKKLADKLVTPKSGSGYAGNYFGDDFRRAYAPGTPLNGAGQMVGLLQFDGFYPNDIAAYAVAAGGGRTNIEIQTVLLDNFSGTPTGSVDGNWEVSLDIEMAMAMAPGLSKIVVFEAPASSVYFNDLLSSMAASNQIKNLSCSWGGGGPNATAETIFKQMAAQGQSFFNASGDSDAFVGSISFPSESRNITQVGGTTLTMNDSGSSYGWEKVWNWGGGTGSSGGSSTTYTIPVWQQGLSMAANQGSTTMRNLPDVAMIADNIYIIAGGSGAGVTGIGGTSCAAPLWAGFMALVNQQAAANGLPSAGFINPALYALGKGSNYPAYFHDTIMGDNFSSGSPTNFPGVAGYDLCTGWGTPTGSNLITALAITDNNQPWVRNGGFETGDFSGWQLTGNTVVGKFIYNAVENAGSFPAAVHSGSYGAFLGDTSVATLAQTVPTVPGQGYLLSFWLDNAASGPVQKFFVNWNTNSSSTNTIYNLLNPPVMAWTNLQFVVIATSTNATLQFGAENDPNYFGLDDVSVTPIPVPMLTTTGATSNALIVAWNALSGVTYQLEGTTNLASPNWTVVGIVNATDTTASYTNNFGAQRQQFFRIRRLP